MGALRSKVNRTGLEVNGVTLGDPVIAHIDGSPSVLGDPVSELWFRWDDSAYPYGVVDGDGLVDIDPED